MKHNVALILLGVGAFVGLNALSGCNAVLGIDQARVEDSGGSGASAAGGSPTAGVVHYETANTCKTDNSACSACISSACTPIEQGQCLADKSCREMALGYSTCLGATCQASETECFEPLFAPGSKVPDCIATSCSEECSATPIYSPCDLYCGCMLSNCTQFGTISDCLTACKKLQRETVNCRWTHCEIAPLQPTAGHCEHAVGSLTCLDSSGSTRPTDCTDKSLKGFYCATDGDCCSGACDATVRKACIDH